MKKIYFIILLSLSISSLKAQKINISRVDTSSYISPFFQKWYKIDVEAEISDSLFYYMKNLHFQLKSGESPWCNLPNSYIYDRTELRLDTGQWEKVMNAIPAYFSDTTLFDAVKQGENKVLVRYQITAWKKGITPVEITSNIDTVYIHPLTASEINGYYFVKNAHIDVEIFSTLDGGSIGLDPAVRQSFVDSLIYNFPNSIWNEIGIYNQILSDYTYTRRAAPDHKLTPLQKGELIERLAVLKSSDSWIISWEARLLEGKIIGDW